jgi:hypothetical protein
LLDPDVMREVGYDACLEIHDTVNFGLAVAEQLGDFVQGWEGQCQYGNERFLGEESDQFAADNSRDSIRREVDRVAGNAMFLKHRSYSHQAEYRFLWDVNQRVSGTIDIVSLRAREYCRMVRAFV